MSRTTSADYLKALQDAEAEDGIETGVYTDESPEELSEAEQMAAAAQGPKKRADGKVLGTADWRRDRPLTTSQMAFAQGVIQGKTLRQAYIDAYPNAKPTEGNIATSAYKLSRHPKVSALIQDAWGQTVEALADDLAATRRFVMRQLVTLSKDANQEGSRLKALELLGRSAGMFRDQQQTTERPITAAELKAQLAGHLRLVAGRRRANGADVNEVEG